MTEKWTLKNRVALLQMLPYDLWNRTGLKRYDQIYLKNTNPRHANYQLIVEKTSIELDLEELFLQKNEIVTDKPDQKIPIITLESRSLLPWSKSLTGRGSLSIPGVLLKHPDKFIYDDDSDQEGDSDLDPITFFRATASPAAQKLARYLAAVPLTLPLMRLVQRVLLPETRQIHLAEVLLSKLVKLGSEAAEKLFENQDGIYYDFVDDVRNRLLRDNYLSETVSIMDTVFRELSVFIDKHTGKTISFQAIVGNPLLLDDVSINEKKYLFASISVDVLGTLGGKYSRVAERIKLHYGKRTAKPIQEESKEEFLTSDFFIGRSAELDTIRTFIESDNASRLLCLHTNGEGGLGKTQLLLRVRSSYQKYEDKVVIWHQLIDFYHLDMQRKMGLIEAIAKQLDLTETLVDIDKYRRKSISSG